MSRFKAFNPAYLIISAGFDTHEKDPIGNFGLKTHDYTQIGQQFKALGLPTLICQEGGYNLEVLGECVKNFLGGFM
jgi:acetoin utilization deacetylase AcuC-like enzyme